MFFLTFLVRSADKTDEDRIVGECENNSEKKNRTPFLLSEQFNEEINTIDTVAYLARVLWVL